MKLLYVMSHPSDRLADERAGHVVRPRQLLGALREHGVQVEVTEAAGSAAAQTAARSYWAVRDVLPAPVALAARDAVRVLQNERFARRAGAVADRLRPDVVLETQVAFSTAGAAVAARCGALLVVDDVSPAEEDEQVYDVRLRSLARRRRRQTLAAADLLVCTSEALREGVLAEGARPERVVVVANGVPPGAVTQRDHREVVRGELGLGRDDVVAVYAGSFQPFHRVDLLVAALARPEVPPRVRLLLVGDGDERAAVAEQADRLGLAHRVTLSGRVPSEEVGRLLSAGDVAVLPATAPYTNPMKLYDYLAAGLPVAAPDQRAVQDVLGSVPAELFTPGSPAALAAALVRLAADPERRRALAEQSRAAGRGHTWHARAAALQEAIAARRCSA